MGDQEDVLGFDSFMEREVDTGYRLFEVGCFVREEGFVIYGRPKL